MEEYERTKTDTAGGGKKQRVLWPPYTPEEIAVLKPKLLNGWDDLSYLNDFWNVVHDERDFNQYSQMAKVWQLREQGVFYKDIAKATGLDQRAACSLVNGSNRRHNLALIYLNHEKLGKPRDGWKWILDCTPKPTNPYPRALQVPDRIRDCNDILEFLKQFPPVSEDSEALKFFGLTSEWAEQHKAELFWFLMAFLVGDGGKYYSDYIPTARHYRKTSMNTRMKEHDSNYRVLQFVRLALEVLGISSYRTKSEEGVIAWHSEATDILTWILQTCIGLKEGERTSHNPVVMPWLRTCPKNLVIAFLQGLADSDGCVRSDGRYCEIASVPNAKFYQQLIEKIGFEAKAYPLGDKPRMTRVSMHVAATIPLFNPIIKSYRFDELVKQATLLNIPPPPHFFSN